VAGQQGSGVLDAGGAFQSRFGEISNLRGNVDDDGQNKPIPGLFWIRKLGGVEAHGEQVFNRQQDAGSG